MVKNCFKTALSVKSFLSPLLLKSVLAPKTLAHGGFVGNLIFVKQGTKFTSTSGCGGMLHLYLSPFTDGVGIADPPPA